MTKLLLAFLSFIMLSVSTFAQDKEKYETIFIYNFTKYINWPEDYIPGKFVIGVLGDGMIVESLESMAKSKKKTSKGDPIEIVKYKSVEEIGPCHILFVPESSIKNMSEVVAQTASQSILLIADTPGMAGKGAVINFVLKDGKLKFELNEENAATRNLSIASQLVSLAIVI
jgi:hypothetical protein